LHQLVQFHSPSVSLFFLEAFKQLEAAEVDPSLLAYSVILNKDPDDYQFYTPQHRIGVSLNKEAGSLIRYYKTGQQEDGYKGYSTNYQDLNIDIYKLELWKLVKEVLRLLNCDVQKLEGQIFQTAIEEDNITAFGTIHTSRTNKRNYINYRKDNNIERNESLAKYQSLCQILPIISK